MKKIIFFVLTLTIFSAASVNLNPYDPDTYTPSHPVSSDL